MSAEIGWASLGIIPSFDKFGSQLDAGTSKAMLAAGASGGTKFGDAAGKSAGSRFGSIFKTAAKASLLGLAGVAAGAFKVGKDSIALASDLGESVNAVNVTYAKQAKAVRKLGGDAAESLGLSEAKFNGLAVQFSAFATQVAGGEGPKVVGVLDDLTTRGADFASVMNLEVADAMALFQSGLAGETEPLRKFGLDLSMAAVTAHGMKLGLTGVNDEFTEGEKVQARYSLLMQQTQKVQGDFSNTSDSLANRQRILSARWDDARAKLGEGLLPIIEDATGFILDKGIPAFEDFSEWFNKKGIPAIGNFADEARPLAESLLPAIGDAAGIIASGLKKAAPFAKDLVDNFRDMPEWAQIALVGGGTGLLAGKKLGLGGGIGSLVSAARPLPVFVTNPGFGGGGGGKGGKGGLGFAGFGAPGLALAGGYALGLDKYVLTMDGIVKRLGANGTVTQSFKRLDHLLGQTDDSVNHGRQTMEEYQRILAGLPPQKTTRIGLTGVQAAQQQIDTLIDSIHAIPSIGSHDAPFVSGAGSSSQPSGGGKKGGGVSGTNQKAGVTVNIGRVEAHDYADFMRQAQQRSQQAGLGGY